MTLPPMPTWYGLHPLIVHFPIALLLAAPALIVLSMIWRDYHRPFAIAALVIMGLGCISAFVAVATGEAAGLVADRSVDINRVLAEHEKLAKWVRLVFSGLTLLFAGLVFGPTLLKKELPARLRIGIMAIFLIIYLAAGLLIANTGHLGGLLVHQYGVQSIVASVSSHVFMG